ncbi:hypothetical protein [Spirosoma flavum]|uniref:Arabinogalactan endo-beta-1,4-galactanase n=1 Tax=Spirosoma flavum TaxID=2048557 RepID=A0ABW6AEF5_9BACT
MKHWLCILFCGSMLLSSACNKQPAAPQTRPFYLGITPWPADFTTPEVEAAYRFVDEHCDIISHHFDEGIPYEEAYTNSNWPTALLADLQTRKSKTPAGKKILLSSSVLALTRNQKAPYSRYATTLTTTTKNQWEALPFNDARVVTAYVNFMKLLIDTLQPDFINYAVESNVESWNLTTFDQYKEFVSQVYQQLKRAYPTTPILLSFMVNETLQSLNFARQLVPYTDYLALSAYPYTNVSSSAGGTTDPALFPATYFSRFLDLAPGKPLCFAETGYIAQSLSIPAFGLTKLGTDAWQDAYLQLICGLVNERKGKFIIWFCHKDYNAGLSQLKQAGVYQDLFALWADTGLVDEDNVPRPAYQTWLMWMSRAVTE